MSSIELFGSWWGHENHEKRFVANKAYNPTNAIGVKTAFYNCSGKEIKYITFSYAPFNSVNDICDKIKLGELTGPIKPNEGAVVFFDHLWFNATISNVNIQKVDIEYMDGSKESIFGSALGHIYTPESEAKRYNENSFHNSTNKEFLAYYDVPMHVQVIMGSLTGYSFNTDSTFYKTYKSAWEVSMAKGAKANKKRELKNRILWIAIIAALVIAVIAGSL